jgi:hypothetical protein
MTTPRPYFWQRLPRWVSRLMLGSLLAVAALAVLVGGFALVAQRNADAVVLSYHYSVSMHIVAMSSVAALSVAVAAAVLRLGQPLVAGIVLIGSALGPMTLVAVPVQPSLVDASTFGDTALWWRVLVGVALLGLMTAWAWWTTKCLDTRPTIDSLSHTTETFSWLPSTVLFVVMTGVGLVAYRMTPQQANEPALRAIVGWALLAAGIAVVTAFARTAWMSLAMLAAVASTMGIIFLAYTRLGGWPGVAGWEFNGMESPIITSVASTVTLLAAPVIGVTIWLAGQGVGHARGSARVRSRVLAG